MTRKEIKIIGGLVLASAVVATPTFFEGNKGGLINVLKVPISSSANGENNVEASISRVDFIEMAKKLLEEPLNMNSCGFIKRMEALGYQISEFQDLIVPCTATAGEEGLLVRRRPSSDNREPSVTGNTLSWGQPVSWIGEIRVTNTKNGSTEIFGLLPDPFRKTEITQPDQIPNAPNVIRANDKIYQIEPAYVRLGIIDANGITTWFVNFNPEYKTLEDGAIVYNNDDGIIGPNLRDQNAQPARNFK